MLVSHMKIESLKGEIFNFLEKKRQQALFHPPRRSCRQQEDKEADATAATLMHIPSIA